MLVLNMCYANRLLTIELFMHNNNHPSNLDQYLISEQLLAEAYDQTGDYKRSLMKKHIALLLDFYGHTPGYQEQQTVNTNTGYTHLKSYTPSKSLSVLLDLEFNAWNRLLAAVIPAAASGVAEIAAFFTGPCKTVPDSATLNALELAGIELIYRIPHRQNLLSDPDLHHRSGLIIDFCDKPSSSDLLFSYISKLKSIWLGSLEPMKGLIWADSKLSWNYELIAACHPEIAFTVAGEFIGSFPDFDYTKPDQHLLEQEWDIFFGPRELFSKVNASRGFTPGLEFSWIWPELDQSFFKSKKFFCKETRI